MPRSLYGYLARRYRAIEPVAVRADHTERAVKEADGFYPLALPDQQQLARTGAYTAHDVCVIGGGLAGLSAAWWLVSHGFRVGLFDARDRPGGRVRTEVFSTDRRVIERGAELIGRNHPAWIRFARLFRLPLTMITDAEMYDAMRLKTPLVVNGQAQNDRAAKALFERLDAALTTLNTLAKHVNPYRPWDAGHAADWDGKPLSAWVSEVTVRDGDDLLRRVLRFQLENMQARPLEDQSLLGLLAPVSVGLPDTARPAEEPSAYWSASEVFRCGAGNEALVTAFIEALGSDVIHTGARVERIVLSHDGCDVTVAGMTPRRYEWVILAAPPQHWPDCAPIDRSWRVPLGPAAKCLITVDRQCWLHDGLSPVGSADDLGLVWEGTDNQNLPAGALAELTLFLGAAPAAAASGDPSPATYCLSRLQKVYPRLGNGSPSAEFVNWPREPHITGGYSCPSPGSVCTRVKGMHDGLERLVFAGEHTSMPWFGYMEGALQSGLRAAHKIAASVGIPEAVDLASKRRDDSAKQQRARA